MLDPKVNPLYYYLVIANAVSNLEKGTKSYRNGMLYLISLFGKDLKIKFKNAEPGTVEYDCRVKMIRVALQSFGLIMLMAIVVFAMYAVIGDVESENFTSNQRLISTMSWVLFVLFGVSGLGNLVRLDIIRARYIQHNYLDEYKPRCLNFNDEQLAQIGEIGLQAYGNKHYIDIEARCGCYSCMNIFYTKDITNINETSVLCPICKKPTVIVDEDELSMFEENDKTVMKELLYRMHEYWIDFE